MILPRLKTRGDEDQESAERVGRELLQSGDTLRTRYKTAWRVTESNRRPAD
jgi:hypothetical protein